MPDGLTARRRIPTVRTLAAVTPTCSPARLPFVATDRQRRAAMAPSYGMKVGDEGCARRRSSSGSGSHTWDRQDHVADPPRFAGLYRAPIASARWTILQRRQGNQSRWKTCRMITAQMDYLASTRHAKIIKRWSDRRRESSHKLTPHPPYASHFLRNSCPASAISNETSRIITAAAGAILLSQH